MGRTLIVSMDVLSQRVGAKGSPSNLNLEFALVLVRASAFPKHESRNKAKGWKWEGITREVNPPPQKKISNRCLFLDGWTAGPRD